MSRPSASDARRGLPRPRPRLGVDALVLVTSTVWALTLNRPFISAALQQRPAAEGSTWSLGIALVVALIALHALLLGLVSTRHSVKPIVAVLTLVGAFVMHYMQAYGVVIDPSMVRNALYTDIAETRELLSWRLARDLLLFGVLPVALLLATRIEPQPWRAALKLRLLLLTVALATLIGALLWQFQPIAAQMRNHKAMRYQVTPANTLWSLGAVLVADARGATKPRLAIGLDAAPGPSWATRDKPRLVVLVVGETARAANWGLNGYARQTTPQLAALAAQPDTPLINFKDVSSCGTNTETSVPCMFAPVGRRDYDEARIRGSESLLHVLQRAGVTVQWVDNQSGCKGVCDGVSELVISADNAPELCKDGRCLDEALVAALQRQLRAAAGGKTTQLLVLHMLGNHGPSYFRRYPSAFERFTPACRDDDLGRCTREEIVNAYDNALLYTDQVLASLIAALRADAAQIDSALLYVSDHGESLGEKNLFLHGLPYAIAPSEQTQVPMVMWWSAGFASSARIGNNCMRERARQPAQHDHLFHTLLTLVDVKTALYNRELDLTRACRAFVPATP